MKKSIKTLLALACASMFASCNILDIEYPMTLNQTNMWQDPTDLTQSVPGIYLRLRSYFFGDECNVFYLNEVRVGDGMWGPSLESKVADNFKINCRHSTLNGAQTIGWSGLYSTIDQANAVLKYADQCNASAEDVAWAKGQAYFARAYSYFWAGRIWGYCPVILVPVESTSQPECYPKQEDPQVVFEQVGKDLEACEPFVSSLGDNKYYATKDAYLMLKAEYALWMYSVRKEGEKYLTMAEDALSEMGISDSRLLNNYADVFSRTNKVNKEVVFALNVTVDTKGGYQVYFCHPANLIANAYQCKNGGPVPINSTQWWASSQPFVDELKASEAAGDTRVATNLGHGNYSSAADKHEITWCNKFLGDMTKSPVVLDNDLLYYRYAQAVMMYAELKYYQKDYTNALNALNIVAKRAYKTADKYTDKTPQAVLDAIVKEYRLEFVAEGVLWSALIRTGAIWDVEPNNTQPGVTFRTLKEKNENILLWPIANGSINKNPGNIKQTQGWS